MRKSLLLFSILILIASSAASGISAQELWQKPASEWSKQEAETVLNKSPWAISQELRMRYRGGLRQVAGTGNIVLGDTVESGTEPPTDFTFTLRLRSGTPIRLALVRLKEIEENFEKMPPEKRSNFIQKYRGLVECPACAENYVLTLSSKSKSNPGADAVYATFGGAKLADLKRYIFLQNDKGEKRELSHFAAPKAPGEEAVFFFPRFDEKGKLLFTNENKYLIFNLTKDEVNINTNFKVQLKPLFQGDAVDF
jgi:hypothetical protein